MAKIFWGSSADLVTLLQAMFVIYKFLFLFHVQGIGPSDSRPIQSAEPQGIGPSDSRPIQSATLVRCLSVLEATPRFLPRLGP